MWDLWVLIYSNICNFFLSSISLLFIQFGFVFYFMIRFFILRFLRNHRSHFMHALGLSTCSHWKSFATAMRTMNETEIRKRRDLVLCFLFISKNFLFAFVHRAVFFPFFFFFFLSLVVLMPRHRRENSFRLNNMLFAHSFSTSLFRSLNEILSFDWHQLLLLCWLCFKSDFFSSLFLIWKIVSFFISLLKIY